MRSFPRSWSFFRALFPGRRRRLGTRRAVSRRGRGGALSGIEGLEGRAMMAVVHWDGGSDGWGTNFLDAVNWVGDVLPGPADTAVIGATGTTAAITLSGTATVAEIDSSRPLRIQGGTLSGARFEGTGAAQLVATSSGGTLSAVTLASNLDVSSGSITIRNSLTLDGATVRIGDRDGTNAAAVTFDGGTQTIDGTGDFVFGAHSSNRIFPRGTSASQDLTIGSGITILEALRTSEAIVDNRVIAESIARATSEINAGVSLTDAFRDLGTFPPLVIRMLRVGEATGALDTALANVTYFYNRDVRESIERGLKLLEPALIFVLGMSLLLIMWAVLSPVYDITRTLARQTAGRLRNLRQRRGRPAALRRGTLGQSQADDPGAGRRGRGRLPHRTAAACQRPGTRRAGPAPVAPAVPEFAVQRGGAAGAPGRSRHRRAAGFTDAGGQGERSLTGLHRSWLALQPA